MVELRFIKIDNTIRLQYKDGFKEVNGDITIECVWADVPLWDSEKQEMKPMLDFIELAKKLK